MKRRDAIKSTIYTATGLALAPMALANCQTIDKLMVKENPLKGKINHSACRWCYSKIPLEKLVEDAQELGLKSIELLNPEEWDTVIKRGLTCAISNGSSLHIPKGFNDKQYHAKLHEDYTKLIPMAADKGITQIICFSGNRNGISDAQGIEISAQGLDPMVKLAEKYNVKLVMELLNSKKDHKDYQCDHTEWGVALAEKLGSPHFSLLYDIYHMQIMEGDVITTIRKHHKYISHYHTGGVPGRNEINETQELNYKAIIQAVYDTGYTGFVAQEFIPKRQDAIASLKEGVLICDV